MVLRTMVWAEPVRGAKPEKYKEDLVAAGHTAIKAFSLIEIEIACKARHKFSSRPCFSLQSWRDSFCIWLPQGWSRYNLGEEGVKESDICSVKKGYGMSVCDMRPIDGASLYSVLGKLPKVLPETLEVCAPVDMRCAKACNNVPEGCLTFAWTGESAEAVELPGSVPQHQGPDPDPVAALLCQVRWAGRGS